MASGKLIAIVGPTASGKTELAIKLALKYNGEIICADSRTVYKNLDIGTAKPTKAERTKVKHHLLNLIEPNQTFTAAQFQKLAKKEIKNIWQKSKLPIVVGGTGLYVDGLLYDFKFGPKADPAKRARLEQMTILQLQNLCKKHNIDLPENTKNKRYLIRAIEQSGTNHKRNDRLFYNCFLIGLNPDKETLRQRIAKRADIIFSKSVEKEATKAAIKYGWDCPGLSGNIYPIMKLFISGDLDLAQAKEKFITADWRLAKRQITWLKRNPDISWFSNAEAAMEFISDKTKKLV